MAAPAPDQLRTLEAQILSAAISDPEACASMLGGVPSERFSVPAHVRLAQVVERVFSEGHAVNFSTLTAAGAEPATIAKVQTEYTAPGSVPYLGLLVAEAYMAREAVSILSRARAQAEQVVNGTGDVFDLMDDVQAEISRVALAAGQGARSDTHIRHAVAEALTRTDEWRRGESSDFAPSGFYSLDRTTGGLPIGELTTLAAMTGAGKTSLLAQSVRSVALSELKSVVNGKREAPRPVVVFSAEMSREQIVLRMAAGMTGLNVRHLRAGQGDPEDFARFDRALGKLAAFPVYVDDEPSPSFSHIAARLTQVSIPSGGEVAYVGVDYDEKIHTEGATEELRVSAIAQGLKNTAKRFACPVLALSQYSRAANHREVPSNSWLRYSGKKEHESAQVIHWMYPEYWIDKGYDPNAVCRFEASAPTRGYLVVSKNRFGPTGDLPIYFDAPTTSFRDPNDPDHTSTARDLASRTYAPEPF